MPRPVASLGPCRWTGLPFQRISPLVGSQIPEMVLISVDLPAPLSPTRAVTWPADMSRSTPASACTGPKLLPSPRSRSSGALPAAAGVWLFAALPEGARPAVAGRAPSPLSAVTTEGFQIPAAWQADLYLAVQSCAAGTKLSAMTVAFMFAVVTHVGLSSTDGTLTLAVVSSVVLFTRADGGVAPARMYMASAAAACASR